MHIDGRVKHRVLFSIALSAVLFAGIAAAQPHSAAPAQLPAAASAVSDRDFVATQNELIKLLRLSPTLTTVVARDPSLLATRSM